MANEAKPATQSAATQAPASHVQGEGDYQAGKAYNDETSEAAKDKAAIASAARDAADALDGPEAADLEAARKATAAVKPQ
jgi:hypothetical protein